MKVDNSGKLSASYSTQNKAAPRDAAANANPAASGSDSVTINPLASRLSAVESKVSGDSGFDAGKVAAIKSAIAAGTFSVNPEKIADGLIASTKELLAR
ncbi:MULTISPECIES: flagellar biosynthesis anti-sigma factor FlgM [Chromobacterium]|uniref:Negative regulator of flagellin synthesis n=1 Tax=Chromobacterium haemolyticum TaxID=394935 RepID=A0A1W0C9H1_9NEIS|nr:MULTISPECIES: flagellar biosynthesis anti-sigma factor FlgM [Chromobacterium]OQS31378.1 flagellar biosynthesis anti-sigma factor FlgM [Chromobacterium haemolyticum]PTU71664.1 flagellar biosynthesis anti-sigma factor FlgM [Chromobacterium haemolyticum]QOZ82870.1 flagellar biosynthesis anti-sigma factor FlgM [Chromobacterium sp. Rain0013]WON82943.1 flagellar biosynthesis anti-sigma factor FlgM [Chromobacterium haemolyticum]